MVASGRRRHFAWGALRSRPAETSHRKFELQLIKFLCQSLRAHALFVSLRGIQVLLGRTSVMRALSTGGVARALISLLPCDFGSGNIQCFRVSMAISS